MHEALDTGSEIDSVFAQHFKDEQKKRKNATEFSNHYFVFNNPITTGHYTFFLAQLNISSFNFKLISFLIN